MAVTQAAREAAFHTQRGPGRNLRRAALVVGAFPFARLPFDTELVEAPGAQRRLGRPERIGAPRPTTARQSRVQRRHSRGEYPTLVDKVCRELFRVIEARCASRLSTKTTVQGRHTEHERASARIKA